MNYMYPIAINIRKTHHVARDRLIDAMFEQASLFAQAGKSGQVSRLYQADAGLSDLRFILRFLADDKRRLTSQLFANIYGHIQDRYLAHTLGIKHWLRYMDDTIIFAHSREVLAVLQQGLKWFVEQSMRLRFSKWSIIPVSGGVSFLGYRIWPTHKLLLRASVVRAKRKINRYTRLGLPEHLERFIGSWRGHAKWANSNNLLTRLGVQT